MEGDGLNRRCAHGGLGEALLRQGYGGATRVSEYVSSHPGGMARYRESLRSVTDSACKRSLRDTIATVNAINRGSKNYFKLGYHRQCFRELNLFLPFILQTTSHLSTISSAVVDQRLEIKIFV